VVLSESFVFWAEFDDLETEFENMPVILPVLFAPYPAKTKNDSALAVRTANDDCGGAGISSPSIDITVRLTELEVPPPGVGLKTVTVCIPRASIPPLILAWT